MDTGGSNNMYIYQRLKNKTTTTTKCKISNLPNNVNEFFFLLQSCRKAAKHNQDGFQIERDGLTALNWHSAGRNDIRLWLSLKSDLERPRRSEPYSIDWIRGLDSRSVIFLVHRRPAEIVHNFYASQGDVANTTPRSRNGKVEANQLKTQRWTGRFLCNRKTRIFEEPIFTTDNSKTRNFGDEFECLSFL